MTRWRIGSVPYLNERPLTAALDDADDVALAHEPPGPLADALVAGRYDAALIPVAEQLRHGLAPLGVGGIACAGAVRSVQVWHDGPRAALTCVRVPAHSRSSVMLLRVLLPAWGVAAAELVPTLWPPDLAVPPAEPALLIGDVALRCLAAGRPTTDLGAAWHALTGTPFVFARWCARPDLGAADRADLAARLDAALDVGLADRPRLARVGAAARGIAEPVVADYLAHRIAYRLGPAHEAGLAEFAARARQAGWLDE